MAKLRRSRFLLSKSLKDLWGKYKQSKLALIGLAIVVFLALVALVAPWISPYPPDEPGVGRRFEPPSLNHLMGTDEIGKDLFSEILFGTRISLTVAVYASLASGLLGAIVGSISGYFGGVIDDLLMRFTDVFQVLPELFLALLFTIIFGPGLLNIVFIISVVSWPTTARLVRAEFLSLKERPFVEAARSIGAGHMRIIVGEILPNAIPPLIISTTLVAGTAVLLESTLSFLGLGDISSPSWGLVLHETLPVMRYGWWLTFFPGLSIALLVLALNIVGEGLNDALDPRFRVYRN
jgi:peptide/nickel transport system permease protein